MTVLNGNAKYYGFNINRKYTAIQNQKINEGWLSSLAESTNSSTPLTQLHQFLI